MLRPNLSGLCARKCAPVGVRLSPNEDCPICFEPIATNLDPRGDPRLRDQYADPSLAENLAKPVWVFANCGHHYHERCVAALFFDMESQNRNCPTCRTPISDRDDGAIQLIINGGNQPNAEENALAQQLTAEITTLSQRERTNTRRELARQNVLLEEMRRDEEEMDRLRTQADDMREANNELRESQAREQSTREYNRPEREIMEREQSAEDERLRFEDMAAELAEQERVLALKRLLVEQQRKIEERERQVKFRVRPGPAWYKLTGINSLPTRVVDAITKKQYLEATLDDLASRDIDRLLVRHGIEQSGVIVTMTDWDVQVSLIERMLREVTPFVDPEIKNSQGFNLLMVAINARNLAWVHVLLWHQTFRVPILARSGTKSTEKRKRKNAQELFVVQFPNASNPSDESVPLKARLIYPFMKTLIEYARTRPGDPSMIPSVEFNPSYQIPDITLPPPAAPVSASDLAPPSEAGPSSSRDPASAPTTAAAKIQRANTELIAAIEYEQQRRGGESSSTGGGRSDGRTIVMMNPAGPSGKLTLAMARLIDRRMRLASGAPTPTDLDEDGENDETFIWRYTVVRAGGATQPMTDRPKADRSAILAASAGFEDPIIRFMQRLLWIYASVWISSLEAGDQAQQTIWIRDPSEIESMGETLLGEMYATGQLDDLWTRDAMEQVRIKFTMFSRWIMHRLRVMQGRNVNQHTVNLFTLYFLWDVLFEVYIIVARVDPRVVIRHWPFVWRLHDTFIKPFTPSILRIELSEAIGKLRRDSTNKNFFTPAHLIDSVHVVTRGVTVPTYSPAFPGGAIPRVEFPGGITGPLQISWYGKFDPTTGDTTGLSHRVAYWLTKDLSF